MKKWRFAMLLAAALALPFGASAADKPAIKLGTLLPQTGPLGAYGKSQQLAIELAVEDVNKAGGVNGSMIDMQFADTQMDPGQAVLMFRQFANDGAFAVIGPMTGTQWETVSPL
ncbi:MAG TPA: hypothetical protein DEB15_04550, partial [Pusillimonas sp.]|nr:hypothetical protein [Pusillimonas sp.]